MATLAKLPSSGGGLPFLRETHFSVYTPEESFLANYIYVCFAQRGYIEYIERVPINIVHGEPIGLKGQILQNFKAYNFVYNW